MLKLSKRNKAKVLKMMEKQGTILTGVYQSDGKLCLNGMIARVSNPSKNESGTICYLDVMRHTRLNIADVRMLADINDGAPNASSAYLPNRRCRAFLFRELYCDWCRFLLLLQRRLMPLYMVLEDGETYGELSGSKIVEIDEEFWEMEEIDENEMIKDFTKNDVGVGMRLITEFK